MQVILSLFDIVLLFYILVSMCGVVNIIFDLFAKKNNNTEIPLYRTLTARIFKKFNLPLAIISVLVSIIKVILIGYDAAMLALLSIFILISLISEIARLFIQSDNFKSGWTDSDNVYKSVFDSVGDYYDTRTRKENIYVEIGEKTVLFFNKLDECQAAVNSTCSHINSFIQLQEYECKDMLGSRDSCLSLLNTLEDNLRQCNKYFVKFIEKIEASSASIKYCTNSESLLEDINNSFQLEYEHQSDHIDGQMKTILSRMNTVSDKCRLFNRLFVSYDEIIQSYSRKIESSIEYKADMSSTITYLLDNIIRNIDGIISSGNIVVKDANPVLNVNTKLQDE